MRDCAERNSIDEIIVLEIQDILVEFGVPAERAYECYDAIRFQCEARAVLLNRVQDRKMPTAGINYYGQHLTDIAQKAGATYDPDQPV